MNKILEREFESTGYSAWINSDIYPDGKIYTKEYTEWLERKINSPLYSLKDVEIAEKLSVENFGNLAVQEKVKNVIIQAFQLLKITKDK